MEVKELDSPEVTETLPPPPPLEGSSVEPVRAPGYVAPAGRSEGGLSSGSSAGGAASAGGGQGSRGSSAQGKLLQPIDNLFSNEMRFSIA